ncbi:hypothetical protein N9B38_02285 [bacterium]|nr:hypothetical protein [bacterium]
MVVPPDMLRTLRGLDPSFRIAAEDRDLCARLRLVGYKLVYHSGAMVYHADALSISYF